MGSHATFSLHRLGASESPVERVKLAVSLAQSQLPEKYGGKRMRSCACILMCRYRLVILSELIELLEAAKAGLSLRDTHDLMHVVEQCASGDASTMTMLRLGLVRHSARLAMAG